MYSTDGRLCEGPVDSDEHEYRVRTLHRDTQWTRLYGGLIDPLTKIQYPDVLSGCPTGTFCTKVRPSFWRTGTRIGLIVGTSGFGSLGLWFNNLSDTRVYTGTGLFIGPLGWKSFRSGNSGVWENRIRWLVERLRKSYPISTSLLYLCCVYTDGSYFRVCGMVWLSGSG